MDSNYLDMLKCLNKAGVDYIMVGGWAVNLHGYVRATIDLDIWILADQENARKVYAALGDFGAPLGDVRPDDFATDGTICPYHFARRSDCEQAGVRAHERPCGC